MSLVGERIGRIRIEALLGRGGMGEVFRGFDEALERPVAVKALRAERRLSDESKARFLREARLLSKLDHPGICRIYDLVEGDDADLLVLELIQGETLAKLAAEGLSPERVMSISEQVARALAAAHREKVVHRDLKPENIMLTQDGAVKILDFGIARSAASRVPGGRAPQSPPDSAPPAEPDDGVTAGLTGFEVPGWAGDPSSSGLQSTMFTREGLVLGTVRYMSPEQAVGGTVAESSDMYSFGVMLHELLTGKPAYGGAKGAELLLKVAGAETESLTGLDQDLADLVDRLENLDPRRRPSALETADRLAWIADRPRRSLRRRVRLGLAAAVTVALLGAAGAVGWSRVQASRQAEVAQRFGADARDIEWLMRAEHLSPSHDIRPAKEEVRRRMAALEGSMAELGSLAQGPGQAALGRGHLALGDLQQARRHLQLAWDAGHRPAAVGGALGDVLGRLYQKEYDRVRAIPNPVVRENELRRVRSELREPALEMLRLGQSSNESTARYVEGRIALYEERLEEGLELAEGAAGESPWFYEAHVLAGDLHYMAAALSSTKSDSESLVENLRKAREAYGRAVEIGRSDPRVRLKLCATGARLATELDFSRKAGQTAEQVGEALEPCEIALSLDPELAAAHSERAALHIMLGRALQRSGQDPAPTFDRALRGTETALVLEPDNPRALATRGWVRLWYGWFQLQRGEDAARSLDLATADYVRVRELAPLNLNSLMNLINCHGLRALNESNLGRDPLPWLDAETELVESALEQLPGEMSFHILAGATYLGRGRHQMSHGIDPEESLRRAAEEYQLVAAGEKRAEAFRDLALAQIDLGDALQAKGVDPRPSYSAAVADAGRALELNPSYGLPQMVAGLAHFGLARYAVLTRVDPEPHLEAAVSSYEEGLAQAPENVEAYAELGQILLLRASQRLEGSESPEGDVERVRRLLERGLQLNPTLTANHLAGARAELLLARWQLRLGRAAGRHLAAAGAALQRGFEANSSDAGLHLAAAELELWKARSRGPDHEAAAGDIRAGLESVRLALETNPRLAEAELIRAELLLLRASRERPASRQEALTALARAEELNPLLHRRAAELVGR